MTFIIAFMFCKFYNSINDLTERITFFHNVRVNVQLWPFTYVRLLNKPCENEVKLREQNLPLKCYQPLEMLIYFKTGSLNI